MAAVVLMFGLPMIVAAALISPSALHNLVHGVLFYAIVGLGLPFVGWQTFLAVFAFPPSGTGRTAAVLSVWLGATVLVAAVFTIGLQQRRKIMIYEIRNYHFRPDLIDAYKAWAKAEAIPHLASQLDVLGFWINSKDAPELNGAPQDHLGTANVTWIIRWRDLAQRNEVLPRILSSPAWQDIFSRVPEGSASYLRIEAKFADALM